MRRGRTVPFQTLIKRGLDHVFTAGRMMTVALVAHNSSRNTICCLASGRVAGTAVAMVPTDAVVPIEVDVQALRGDGALLTPRPDPIAEKGETS